MAALEVYLEADTYETDPPRTKGAVILGGLDISPYVREMTLRTGVDQISALELTLVNIRVNRKAE